MLNPTLLSNKSSLVVPLSNTTSRINPKIKINMNSRINPDANPRPHSSQGRKKDQDIIDLVSSEKVNVNSCCTQSRNLKEFIRKNVNVNTLKPESKRVC